MLSLTKLIKQFSDQLKQVSIFNSLIVKSLIINIQSKATIQLLNKKDGNTNREFKKCYKTIN